MILSANLSELWVETVLVILQKWKATIGWKMSNIHGITLTLCIHTLYIEEGHKSSAQHQRRLNLIMKDVVRKEVMKWLDAGILDQISDSKWVSLVIFVAKKCGIIVVMNNKNELIPTRKSIGWFICLDYRN